MAIKVLIRRKFKENSLGEASRLMIKTRYDAMERKGYISSETLSNLETPQEIVVMSMWQTPEDWTAWRNSNTRKENEILIEKLTEGTTQIEVYNLGMPRQ